VRSTQWRSSRRGVTDGRPPASRVHGLRHCEYGVDFNIPMGVGKVAIGDKVTVELDIQLVAP
jgi:hypothetical protein